MGAAGVVDGFVAGVAFEGGFVFGWAGIWLRLGSGVRVMFSVAAAAKSRSLPGLEVAMYRIMAL